MRKALVVGFVSVGLLGAGFTGTALADGEPWGKGDDMCIPSKGADCADVNHKWKVDADGRNLEGINLKRSKLHGASLQGADLSDAKLNRAVLKYADLDGAELDDASLKRATMDHTEFSGVSAQGADFFEIRMKNMDIKGGDFRGANLDGARITNSEIVGANFSALPPRASSTSRLASPSASLDDCLHTIDQGDSECSGVSARNSTWKNTYLYDVNFSNADLSGSTFQNVGFRGLNLTNADLSNSTFLDAVSGLGGMNMSGTIFNGSTFDLRWFSAQTHTANIAGAQFQNVKILGPRKYDGVFKGKSNVSQWAPTLIEVINNSSKPVPMKFNPLLRDYNFLTGADGERPGLDYNVPPGKRGYYWAANGDDIDADYASVADANFGLTHHLFSPNEVMLKFPNSWGLGVSMPQANGTGRGCRAVNGLKYLLEWQYWESRDSYQVILTLTDSEKDVFSC